MLSVICTHFNKTGPLLESLESIKKACADFDSELILVVSEEVAGTEKKVKKKFPDIKYFGYEENVGYSRSVNKGLKQAQGEYLLIVNSDIKLAPDAVLKMRDYIDAHQDVGLIGPKIYTPGGKPAPSPRRFYRFPWTALARRSFFGQTRWGKKALGEHLMAGYDRTKPRKVDWVLGEVIFTKAKYVDKVGLIDERFFLYFTDVDWCWRFWEAGLKVVYLPEAEARELEKMGEITKTKGRGILSIFSNLYSRIHLWEYFKFMFKHFGKPNPRKV